MYLFVPEAPDPSRLAEAASEEDEVPEEGLPMLSRAGGMEEVPAQARMLRHGRGTWSRLMPSESHWWRLGLGVLACVALVATQLPAPAGHEGLRPVSRWAQGSGGQDMQRLAAQPSCAVIGCGVSFDPVRPCQCNPPCKRFGSCCSDYDDQCVAPPLCKDLGCKGLDATKSCQCDPECKVHDTCCADALDVCQATGKWPPAGAQRPSPPSPEELKEMEHPATNCGKLKKGEKVEVRDAALTSWLQGVVTGLNPVKVTPDGWGFGYAWRALRRHGVICHTDPEQMTAKNTSHAPDQPGCLCLFDIDRTLTCEQGHAEKCAGTQKLEGVYDLAFGGGTLVLSAASVALKNNQTFCSKCLRGVISQGAASGAFSDMRSEILKVLGGVQWTLSDVWSNPAPNVTSLLVCGAPDTKKQDTARQMVDWLNKEKAAAIRDEDVYFFDDNILNAPPFNGTGFNAHQVSCASRWVKGTGLGLCGATADEIVRKRGIGKCA